jgi:hypothetical protein
VTNGREVDLDLLADYIGGALDGTPEAATVERLVAEDPVWTQAYADTSAAVEAVRADLSTLAADRDQMPAEVLGRLEAALTPVPPEEGATVGQLAARRRWMRRLVPVAAAATVLAFVGVGAAVLRPDSGAQDTATSSGGQAADRGAAPAAGGAGLSAREGAPQPLGGAGSPGTFGQDSPKSFGQGNDATATPPILATGTDYTRDTVARLAGPRTALGPRPTGGPGESGAEPSQLRRFTEPDELSACLAAISSALGQPSASVRLVDLAQFEGSPAIVVVIADSVWVSGPDCGQTGPDTRYSTRTLGR